MHVNTTSSSSLLGTGWSLGPIEGAAQCPNDSGAASGTFTRFIVRHVVYTFGAQVLRF